MNQTAAPASVSRRKIAPLFASLSLLAACVTVNVYFPAAAAEKAADRFIREVYGDQLEKKLQEADPAAQPQSGLSSMNGRHLLASVIDFLIQPALAQQPDITISTPGINKLQSAMEARHDKLKPYYASGAVAMDRNGLIAIRDAAAIPLKDRNLVKKLVADENSDRQALYREIAVANGHPEWEAEIQAIFATRWIANAPAGWWYKNVSGQWQQK